MWITGIAVAAAVAIVVVLTWMSNGEPEGIYRDQLRAFEEMHPATLKLPKIKGFKVTKHKRPRIVARKQA